MKLSKGLAIGALALSTNTGCTINTGVPEECDSAGKIPYDAQELYSRGHVQEFCSREEVINDTRQSALTCVYGVTNNGENLLQYETSCTDSGLPGALDVIFDEENTVAYCVSTGPELECVDK